MGFPIELRSEGCILLALLCLILPMDWVLAAIIAAVFHEACHVLAVSLLGGKLHELKIGAAGAAMYASGLPPWADLTALLAGPGGSFSLLMLGNLFPKLALCGLIQGAFNLLPLGPLDGGRAVHCLCRMVLPPEIGEWVCRVLEITTVLAFLALGLWGSFGENLGSFPMILAIALLLRVADAKKSCQEGILRVQ